MGTFGLFSRDFDRCLMTEVCNMGFCGGPRTKPRKPIYLQKAARLLDHIVFSKSLESGSTAASPRLKVRKMRGFLRKAKNHPKIAYHPKN